MIEPVRVQRSALLLHHQGMLATSGISDDVVLERQYVSVTEKAMLERLGFSTAQRIVPGLLIPLWSVTGEVAGYQYRPDLPRTRGGRAIKYETRPKQRSRIDVPPRITAKLADPAEALWITEGAKKADSAVSHGLTCVDLSGVWNWRGRNDEGGMSALGDWENIPLKTRKVVLAFDSDSTTNPSVYEALARLKNFLETRGAEVYVCHLPDAENGAKVGLDDYLVGHGHLGADALRHIIDQKLGERPTASAVVPMGIDGFHLTEVGNADRFIALHGDHLRYVALWGRWLVFDGCFWAEDHRDVTVSELGKDISRTLWKTIEDMPQGKDRDRHVQWAKASETSTAIMNTIRLARGIPGTPVGHEELDLDPWIVGATNGIVDLSTGLLEPHDPEMLMTRCLGTWYDPDAEAPRWEQFLEDVLPDAELRTFVQRAVGYCLTGSTGEQCMFLPIGVGANGKSTFIETMMRLFGTYGGTIAKDLLIAQRHEAHPTSAADLFRLRFTSAVETEQSNAFAEARVKSLTGGDLIKARRMREDFWSFTPTHKIWLAANHLPKITGTDAAIWRRIKVVPFDVVIPEAERDPYLLDALQAELPGILAWAVRGCTDWLSHGLGTPSAVQAATDAYRAESDWFAAWLDDTGLELAKNTSILTNELTRIYRDWAIANGEEPLGRRTLASELERRGCRAGKSGSARFWSGITKAISEDL